MKLFCLFFTIILFVSCNHSHRSKRRQSAVAPYSSITSPSQNEDSREVEGKVVSIADGDTFTVLLLGNEQEKIRLHGIDCPEKKQDFGQLAKHKLSELVFGKIVKIERLDTDRYGRTIAMVFDEAGKNVNEEMLKAGLAWHYLKYDSNPEWDKIEAEARAQKLGLWAQPNPTPPWEWRRR